MLATLLLITLLSIWFLPGISGQTTNATCLPYYQWAFNSHKQSPCQVASTLLSVCNGGSYNVPDLPDQTHYLGPTLSLANPCQCNTVVYSLMSACAACQGRTYDTWSTWSGNCPMVTIKAFPMPIPPKTYVPAWAYLDVKEHDNFDQTLAKENSNKTESTAIPKPTRSKTSSTVSSSASPTPSNSSTAPSSSGSSIDRRSDIIIGSIVAGAVAVSLMLGLGYWYLERRRRTAQIGVLLPSPVERSPEPPVAAPGDMRQYLANTYVPAIGGSSINSSSLASPTSAVFSNSSSAPSIKSERRSNR